MARHIEDEVEYYYDSHPTEEDLMGETAVHAALVHYLVEVLSWLFAGQPNAVYENLNFYLTSNKREYPIVPDIAVIKGVATQPVKSWHVGVTGPAPHVVFEIASEETWRKDLGEKPTSYAQMGAQEYIAYDPNEPPLFRSSSRRLFGWQLDPDRKVMKEMPIGPRNAIWSSALESWLVPDGAFLRLYDRSGRMRLTKAEALAEKLRSLGIDPDMV